MSLEQDLKSQKVTHLDLTGYCLVGSGTAVHETLTQMRSKNVNVCLIAADDQLKGIFTDRDVITKVAASPDSLNQPIDAVMTTNPVSIKPDMAAIEALWLMDENGFRNLPVVEDDGRVVGNMTHQAVINFLAARYPVEVQNRPPRPDQFPRKQEGGD